MIVGNAASGLEGIGSTTKISGGRMAADWGGRRRRVEEVADARAVFGGDGEDVAEAEPAEVFGGGGEGGGVDLVDGEEDGLAAAEEESGEGDVGRGQFGAAVYHHDDDGGFGEGDLGLEEDFGGDEGRVVGDDAAGVDEARGGGLPLDEAVDAVAGDSGLVADDGAAGTGEAIEEGGLADVGAAADGDEWQARDGRVEGGVILIGEEFGLVPGAEFGGGGVGFGMVDVGGARGVAPDDSIGGGGACGGLFGLWSGLGAPDFGASVRRDSFSGERVGVRFFFSSSARLVARVLRLRGRRLAPVVGVVRGARPSLGRVDAWRCFLPRRLRSSRCAIGDFPETLSASGHYRRRAERNGSEARDGEAGALSSDE